MAGQAFAWTQVLPTLISLNLSLMSLVTSQIMFFFFGLYLQGMQLILWIFQSYFQYLRPNPICQVYHSYAFPNIEMFYALALVTFVIAYGFYWDYAHSWLVWLFLYIVAFAPPIILVWFSYSLWWEVVFSGLLGVGFTWIFVLTLKLYIAPILPYLLNSNLAWWLGYVDTYLMCKTDQKTFSECRRMLQEIGEL